MNLIDDYTLNLVLGVSINDLVYLLSQIILILLVSKALYEQFIGVEVKKRWQSISIRSGKITRRFLHLINSFRERVKVIAREIYWRITNLRPKNIVLNPHNASITLTAYPPEVKITRGKAFWTYAALAWTILSVLYVEINGTYSPLQQTDFSTLPLLLNMGAITWLCFYSRWFRYKIARFVERRSSTAE